MNIPTLLRSARGQLGLIAVAVAAVGSASVWLSLGQLDEHRHDALVLNVAGRQRMLLTRAVGNLVEAVLDGDTEARAAWRRDIREFEGNLAILVEGGTISQGGERVEISRDPDSPLLSHREAIEDAWDALKRDGEAMLASGPDGGADGGRSLGSIRIAADSALVHLERAVREYQTVAESRVEKIRNLQLAFGALGLGLLLLAMGWMRKSLVLPLRHLARAAKRMEEGDLATPVNEGGLEEIRHVSGAMEAMRETLDRMIDEEAALSRLATGALYFQDPADVAQAACDAVGDVVRAGGVGIWLRDQESGALELAGSWGWIGEWPQEVPSAPGGNDVDVSRVARTGVPLFRPPVGPDDDPPMPERARARGARVAAVLPLPGFEARDSEGEIERTHGVLALYRKSPSRLADREISFLSLLAQHTGMAIQKLVASAELSAAEERYHSLLDRIPVGVYRTGSDGAVELANPAMAAILDAEDETRLIGRRTSDFYADPDDRRRFLETLEEEGEIRRFEARLRTCTGAGIWGEVDARAIRDSGGLVAYEGVIRDITDRKAAEEARGRSERVLEGLLDLAPDGIIVIDERQRIVLVNRTAEELFDYEEAELLGEPLDRLVPAAARASHREHIRAFAGGADRTSTMSGRNDIEGIRSDGTIFPLEASVGRVEIGERTRFMALVRDITERLETQERLEEGRRISALTTMAAGIAHHFNNRLTVLRGHADLALLDLPEGHHLREDIRAIVKDAKAAAGLAERILVFAGGRKGKRSAICLGRVLMEEVEAFQEKLRDEVTLTTRVPDEPVEVVGDPAHLGEAIHELLQNAGHATRDGGTISVVLGREAETAGSAGRASIRIEDSGTGMEDETLAHCRDPFFSTKRPEKATGLGLSTVHGVAREMAGRLEIRSELGVGTVVELHLPLAGSSGIVEEGGSTV